MRDDGPAIPQEPPVATTMPSPPLVPRLVTALALAMTVPTLSGCEEDTAPTHVACIGDSITVGDGASAPQETYPAALQGMLGSKAVVKTFARSGTTALGVGAGDRPYESQPEYAAAKTFVSEAGPDARVAVFVMLGTNDSKVPNWDLPHRKDQFITDYGKLLDTFAALPTHPTVYVATPIGAGKDPCCGIRSDVLTKEVIPTILDLAKARNLAVIDLTTLIAGHPEILPDGVHPNDKGYEALAAKVRETLAACPPKPQPGRSFLSRLGH